MEKIELHAWYFIGRIGAFSDDVPEDVWGDVTFYEEATGEEHPSGPLTADAAKRVAGVLVHSAGKGRHPGVFAPYFAPLLAWADKVSGDDPDEPAVLWRGSRPVAVLTPLRSEISAAAHVERVDSFGRPVADA